MMTSTLPDMLIPGAVIASRYRIEGVIGEGGMGRVYRATQLDLGREVAVKVLLPSRVADERAMLRFQREAQLAQRLDHPNTVRIFELGRVEDGTPFMVFELLRGKPLDALMREGKMPLGRVVRVVVQVLKALMNAHAEGIVHRDVKPSNVFVGDFAGESDFTKVLDFGIAKAFADEGAAGPGPQLTRAGHAIGTPSYMAPEQVKGAAAYPSTDLYALGLVMGEMLTGEVVLRRDSEMETCLEQLSPNPVPLPPEVLASPLGPVIRRATQKALELRYATAAEMLADVERAMRGAVAAAQPTLESQVGVVAPTVEARYVPLSQSAPAPLVSHGPHVAPPSPHSPHVAPHVPAAPPPPVASGRSAYARAPEAPAYAAPPPYVPPPRSKGRSPSPVVLGVGALVALVIASLVLAWGVGAFDTESESDGAYEES